ncbi:MAG: hypothetical protein GF364_07935 [Candidatus Lokiarchaeota archaeon]|nr:hypothetical protein [Candidatus Lokiarchaeota archaeon]
MSTNKLDYMVYYVEHSGNLEKKRNLALQNMKSFDIILIFHEKKKKLYVWVGRDAPNSYRKLITNLDYLIEKIDEPTPIDEKIIIEQDNPTKSFLKDLNIKKKEYQDRNEVWTEYLNTIKHRINLHDKKTDELVQVKKYKKAIAHAKKSREYANSLHDIDKVEVQDELIKKLQSMREEWLKEQETNKKIEEKIRKLKQDIKQEEGSQANETADELMEIYSQESKETIPETTKKLIEEARKLYDTQVEYDKLKRELDEKLSESSQMLDENRYDDTITLLNDSLKKAEQNQLNDYVAQINQKIQEAEKLKELTDVRKELDEKLSESSQMLDENRYDDTITLLNDSLKKAEQNQLDDYVAQINQKIQEAEKLKELTDVEKELDKKIAQTSQMIDEKDYSNALELLRESKQTATDKQLDTYIQRIDELFGQILKLKQEKEKATRETEELKRKKEKEYEKLVETAKELEQILNVEEDVLPLREEFTIEELIGDSLQNIDEINEQLNILMETHRVEVSEEITSKNTIRSESGEVREISKTTDIEETSDQNIGDDGIKQVKYSVDSILDNPFDETIEEAIIEDIIPYNFEIKEIKIDDEPYEDDLNKNLTKEGLEIQWQFHNIEPKGKVKVTYDLHRRISRTIILSTENQINIIKNHSNLKPLNATGLYDAILKFSNGLNQQISGAVIEDIVPMLYVYSIKEPDDMPSGERENKNGALVKWQLNDIPVDYSNVYEYQLIEIYRYEQLKIKVNKLAEEAFKILEKGHIPDSLKQYKEIKKILAKYQ